MTEPVVEHDLAAILSAVATGEDGSERALAADRQGIGRQVERRGGRLLDSSGDALLAEFTGALDAVRCALDLQSALAARNDRSPHGHRMDLRIGVHVCGAHAGTGRSRGAAVNAAARLRALSPPGGICISGAVRQQLGAELAVSYQDLGTHALDGASEPVHAYRVYVGRPRTAPLSLRRAALVLMCLLIPPGLVGLGAVAYLAPAWRAPAGDGPALTSIAVLPFRDLSPDGGEQPLADGVADALIEALVRSGTLRVAGRDSAFALRGADVAAAGARLGVGSVVEGSVQSSGDRLRVTAQLTRVSDGAVLWSAQFDRAPTDAPATPSELARAIAEAIGAQLEIAREAP